MTFLDRFNDAGAIVPPHWSVHSIVTDELARLLLLEAVAVCVASWDGRIQLDSEDARHEAARSKVQARAVAHAVRCCFNAWATEGVKIPRLPRSLKPQIRTTAAMMDWDHYAVECESDTMERCRLIASWAVRTSNVKFGNRAVSRLLSEIDRIQLATDK